LGCLWEVSTTLARKIPAAQPYPWDDGEDDFDGSLIETGRRVLPFTYVHDWVLLSAVSPAAKCLYAILRAHVYDKSGTQACGPRQEDLALMMGLSEGSKVSRYIKELKALGALDVKRWGNPARNKYTVHEAPPDGYGGPTSIAAWKEFHAPERARRRDISRVRNLGKKKRQRDKLTAGQDQLPLDGDLCG
jgi:hypothetical protein